MSEVHFPNGGHHFFERRPDRLNSILDGDLNARRSQIVRGYRAAAEVLAEKVIKEFGGVSDTISFPLIFLYRQVFELELKALLEISGHRVGIQPIRTSHKLLEVWRACERVLTFLELREWPGERDAERLLIEFDSMDAGSYGFRFHTDTKGRAAGPIRKLGRDEGGGFTSYNFDLLGFIEAADALSNFLEVIRSEVWDREIYYLEWELNQD